MYFESNLFSKIKPELCLRQSGWGKVRHETVDKDINREDISLLSYYR